jgi:DNA-binding beta-propeller fold protein YncE
MLIIYLLSAQAYAQSSNKGAVSKDLNYPYGIAINSSGYVYVAEYFNDCIKVFDPNGIYLYQWGGFSRPTNIAINSSDYIYVTDYYCIKVFDPAGKFVNEWSGKTGESDERWGPYSIAIIVILERC